MLLWKDRKRKFSSFEIERNLNIKRVTLQDWLSRGFIDPEKKADGRGTKNKFSVWNLYQIKLFQVLIEHGLSREEASKRAKEYNFANLSNDRVKKLKSKGIDFFDEKTEVDFLVIKRNGESLASEYKLSGEKIDMSLYQNDDEIHFVNLTKIMREVNKAF